MKTSNYIVLLISMLYASYTQTNTLIITRGPACCGMGTDLCNAISIANNSYNIFSQNDLIALIYYNLYYDLFPNEIEYLLRVMQPRDISVAITYHYITFKDMVDEDHQQKALAIIDEIRQKLENPIHEKTFKLLFTTAKHMVMTKLAYYAASNQNVVWETGLIVNWDEEIAELKKQFDNVIEVITYCPPTSMIEKWHKKNELAINTNKGFKRKLLKQVLTSFFNSFVTEANPEQQGIIILTKQECDTIFSDAYDYISNHSDNNNNKDGIFIRYEFSIEELMAFKKEIYTRFKLDNVDKIYLVPAIPYDILIDNQNDCLEFAQTLK